jgi:hypothetical protein
MLAPDPFAQDDADDGIDRDIDAIAMHAPEADGDDG